MHFKTQPLYFPAIIVAIFLLSLWLTKHGIAINDFQIYWAACKTFLAGQNIYDLKNLQSNLENTIVSGVWNPPWIFAVFSILGYLPLSLSASILVTINLTLGFLILHHYSLTTKLAYSIKTRIFSLLASACLLTNFYLGQFGIILTYCIFNSYHNLTKGRYGAALLWLIPMSFKPHVGFAITMYILCYILRLKKYHAFILPAGIMIIATLVSLLVNPESTVTWLSGEIYPGNWLGSTLSNEMIIFQSPSYSYLFNKLPSIVALIGAVAAGYLSTKQPSDYIFGLLCFISITFAPYGAIFDHCIIIFPLFQIASRIENFTCSIQYKNTILTLIVLIGWIPMIIFPISIRIYYIAYPFIIFIIWQTVFTLSQREQGSLSLKAD